MVVGRWEEGGCGGGTEQHSTGEWVGVMGDVCV